MEPGIYAEKEKARKSRTHEHSERAPTGACAASAGRQGWEGCSLVSRKLPSLQGILKDTAAFLASLRSYLEPSWCCLSRLTWSNADAMLCQPQEAVLRLVMQVLPDRWRPHGASSVFLGGLDILETDLSLWLAGTQLCGSLGSWALHADKASYLILFERERLVPILEMQFLGIPSICP